MDCNQRGLKRFRGLAGGPLFVDLVGRHAYKYRNKLLVCADDPIFRDRFCHQSKLAPDCTVRPRFRHHHRRLTKHEVNYLILRRNARRSCAAVSDKSMVGALVSRELENFHLPWAPVDILNSMRDVCVQASKTGFPWKETLGGTRLGPGEARRVLERRVAREQARGEMLAARDAERRQGSQPLQQEVLPSGEPEPDPDYIPESSSEDTSDSGTTSQEMVFESGSNEELSSDASGSGTSLNNVSPEVIVISDDDEPPEEPVVVVVNPTPNNQADSDRSEPNQSLMLSMPNLGSVSGDLAPRIATPQVPQENVAGQVEEGEPPNDGAMELPSYGEGGYDPNVEYGDFPFELDQALDAMRRDFGLDQDEHEQSVAAQGSNAFIEQVESRIETNPVSTVTFGSSDVQAGLVLSEEGVEDQFVFGEFNFE